MTQSIDRRLKQKVRGTIGLLLEGLTWGAAVDTGTKTVENYNYASCFRAMPITAKTNWAAGSAARRGR
jgi:hypothetical protein